MVKVLGADNMADVLTKYVDKATLQKALGFMGMELLTGRPECAPAAMGA